MNDELLSCIKTFYTFLLHFALSFDRGIVMFMCLGGNEIKQLKKYNIRSKQELTLFVIFFSLVKSTHFASSSCFGLCVYIMMTRKWNSWLYFLLDFYFFTLTFIRNSCFTIEWSHIFLVIIPLMEHSTNKK